MRKLICALAAALTATFVITSSLTRAQQPQEYVLGPDSQRQPGVPQGKVTKLEWTSQIYPGTVRDYWIYVPARYDPAKPAWLTTLVRTYPNVLVIDVGELLVQVQSIMDQVARAVEFVFLFTLAGGVLVLEAAIAATQDERRYDAAVLRTLGASERQLSAAQLSEFLALGALAGVLAASGATATGFFLADRVFQIPFSFDPALWVIGISTAAACVALAGWFGTRSTLRQPPLAALREAT